ncbi:hypothetical protein B0H63DRAFT_510404 [Podospora didyma]|uniref:2EXR domain-containing protein n=1 Tax=Podospora didyma TaxID=330526 RepID=A0AAE0NQ44_9PEZI|nr:hypothetical protein B0H63DRAFT_510404 [Podospora didyma]
MSDSSDDSDHIGGYVVADDSGGDESEGESANEDHSHHHDTSALIDLEASEDDESGSRSGEESGSSDSDSDSSSGSDDESSDGGRGFHPGFENEALNWDEGVQDVVHDSFPQFSRFPPEICLHIWEAFCPDLAAKARVYHFITVRDNDDANEQKASIWQGPHLEDQTKAARIVLAVNHSSREFALKRLPDTLAFRGGGSLIRFNPEMDIVLLTPHRITTESTRPIRPIPGFSEKIRLLGVLPSALRQSKLGRQRFFAPFDNLKAVYFVCQPRKIFDPSIKEISDFPWYQADKMHKYIYMYSWDDFDESFSYCWPDVNCGLVMPKGEMLHLAKKPYAHCLSDLDNPEEEDEDVDYPVPAWPLLETRKALFHLYPGNRGIDLDDISDSDGSDEELDDYESSGIDDSDLGSDSEDGDPSNGDLTVIDNDSSEEGDSSGSEGNGDDEDDGGASTFAGFSSPLHQKNGTIDLTGDDNHAARFSSPEGSEEDSSVTLGASDSEGEPEAAVRPSLKRSRGRIIDSDSEEEAEEERPKKRRNVVVLSDDENDDAEEGGDMEIVREQPRRRRRAVIDDDDDDDDDDDEEDDDAQVVQTDATRSYGPAISVSEGSDSDSDDSDDDDSSGGEEDTARPLSLAERLQLHREENPIPISDEEDSDSDVEEISGDDYSAPHVNDFQDDDEENEPFDEEEPDGMMMGDDSDDEGY